jgi:presenilin 1
MTYYDRSIEPTESSPSQDESATTTIRAPLAPGEQDEGGINHHDSSVVHQDSQQQREDDDNCGNDDGDGDDDDNNNNHSNKSHKQTKNVLSISETELMYTVESYGAIVAPVSLTMILSSLAVIYINNDETMASSEELYSQTYNVVEVDDSNSTAANVGASIINTTIIVSVICAATFIVVLLYKFRCMKIFYGYMVIVTALLLGYFTSNMFIVAIEVYGWRVDKLSFALIMYNYAAVGTIAIFYSRGIPLWITQGYLIGSSVCMAWQLTSFNEWMAWSLLIVLALYDLFAVLSPCGPLKALAKLISAPGAPALPGLLYEAPLPEGISKTKKLRRNNDDGQERSSHGEDSDVQTDNDTTNNAHNGSRLHETQHRAESTSTETSSNSASSIAVIDKSQQQYHSQPTSPILSPSENITDVEVSITPGIMPPSSEEGIDSLHRHSAMSSSRSARNVNMTGQVQDKRGEHDMNQLGRLPIDEYDDERSIPEGVDTSNTGKVALALAKMYKCPIIDDKGVLRTSRFVSTWKRYYSYEELRSRQDTFTAKQLRAEVTVIFPSRGGTMRRSEEQKFDTGVAYTVYNRFGEALRKFVVTTDGKVMQVVKKEKAEGAADDGADGSEKDSIKLGLGDFVFYSVLVAEAAQYSYTAFAVCFLVILAGLAATLVILAVKGKALPALPISIFLGVIGYLWTRYFMQPWVREVMKLPFYV